MWKLRLNSLRRPWKIGTKDWRNEKVTWGVNERKWGKVIISEKQVHAKTNVFNLSYW